MVWYAKILVWQVWRLLPVQTLLPDYLGSDSAARARASDTWWHKVFQPMQRVLRRAAVAVLAPSAAHAFVRSVTEHEMDVGVLARDSVAALRVSYGTACLGVSSLCFTDTVCAYQQAATRVLCIHAGKGRQGEGRWRL